MIRVFAGVSFPRMIQEQLAALCGGIPGARWSERENFHLTLRFIGEVDHGTLADIDTALARVVAPPFSLSLTGAGVFGGAKPRVLWAGVAASPPLLLLQGRVESALSQLDLPLHESRRYTPHVTLARLKDPAIPRLTRFLGEHALFQAGPFPVNTFHLYESCSGRSGVTYTILQSYPLGSWNPEGEDEDEEQQDGAEANRRFFPSA